MGLSTDSKTTSGSTSWTSSASPPAARANTPDGTWTTAHTGLNITEEDWTIAVERVGEHLNKFKVPAREQQEVARRNRPAEKQIVGR